MRRFSCAIILVFAFLCAYTQSTKLKSHKYPSLLWEISGNGLKKNSYLFGTMHVSSKMVFNLSDSFYKAIRGADVVALETNPESWQEEMFRFNFENELTNAVMNSGTGYRHAPEDFLTIQTLQFRPYEKLIESALVSNPSTINNLLYRTYNDGHTDFEEDTYLDLYIYQVGKKWGKQVFGVERYAESMKLAMEAYMDGMKDKNRRDRSADTDDDFSYAKLEEAYRTGNLDLLDTINRVNSFSALFDEKFLYKRNDIQAASIDSILSSGTSLFVGVGAAHLPGQRGVIEILRRRGYKLRPIKMGERNSLHKEAIEKLQVPVVFETQSSIDGFYKVQVPGKLYRFAKEINDFDQVQYADMANGSYYAVSRVQTNALLWGHATEDVFREVDSLLYENIPGKILSKKVITKNGYKGFDITNRTRRGDHQRYQIFCTPFEVIVFKISGNGDYIKANGIGDKFFNSIQLKEYNLQWKKFSPSFGGFEIELPHDPYITKSHGWQFLANDQSTGADFQVIRTDIHNYSFAEEDSFDLALLEESFTSSDFVERTIERKQTTYKGYPALEASYQYHDGSVARVRYLLQGAHYYTLIAHARKDVNQMTRFLNSFAITPFQYHPPVLKTDTALYYTVNTTFFPAIKNPIGMPAGFENLYSGVTEDDDEPAVERTIYRDRLIANDTTGEKIYISYYKSPRYFYLKDSIDLKKQDRFLNRETSWVINTKRFIDSGENKKTWEYVLTDTNSSRAIWTKSFYRNGVSLTIRTEIDTLTKPSEFLALFFESFHPSDTLQGFDPLTKKTPEFFKDVFSSDTVLRKRALKSVVLVSFEFSDLPQLKKAVSSLSWLDKSYINTKKDFITKLGSLNNKEAANYLKELYYAAGDTIEFQYAVLEALLAQKTTHSYNNFKDILISEPPVINLPSSYDDDELTEEVFLEQLYDSLKLTSTIIKDLLPLMDIDDYKYPIMRLMSTMLDSNLLKAGDYQSYVPGLLLEAKQAWKKQAITEKNKSIYKAQRKEIDEEPEKEDWSNGNETLSLYVSLLMPMWDKNAGVPALLQQMLKTNDQELKYQTALSFIQYGQPVADSILSGLTETDAYRYPLYTMLKDWNKPNLFPSKYNNHISLAESKLWNTASYNHPDSIVFLQRLPLAIGQREGFVYFFKYKRKKEDANWKLASVGLVPSNPTQFEWESKTLFDYDFTTLSDIKLKEDEPVSQQLEKRIKQLLFLKHPSARQFYVDDDSQMPFLPGLSR